ncbi:hypothetical protein ACH42_15650 [Endozoicomonas sp. (ex Bugula neritina AB1)]|nr:hypothetical protein ACH42_15650 [Endozoicomonas sp. (ex Bugula neritina AB1)]
MNTELSRDLHQTQQRVTELYTHAERHFTKRFKQPYIRLDLRGDSAGQALPGKCQLRFNPILLRENRDHFVKQTIAHEVAHLLAHELFGPRVQAHGKEWQAIMINVFGLPADRCHTYDTRRSSKRHWLYQCMCEGKTIPLSTIRHNRVHKGTVYLCNQCRGPLQFLREERHS